MSDDLSLGEAVNRTARLLRRLADNRLATFGLSAGHLPVLTALMSGDAMSQKALTEHAGIEQPTMAATLARMKRDGAIVTQVNPGDGRSVLFRLSARTEADMAGIRAAIDGLGVEALAGLSPPEIRNLHEMLAKIGASVEKALSGATHGLPEPSGRARPPSAAC